MRASNWCSEGEDPKPTITLAEARAATTNVQPAAIDSDLNDELDVAEKQASSYTVKVQAVQLEKLKLENEKLQNDHDDQRANRKMRENYAKWVFGYLVGYSICVGLLLFTSSINDLRFHISDGVLQILVGSTAASAIGLVLAVTTGLFNNRRD